MFIYSIKKKFDDWVPARRSKDNMKKIERQGLEDIKKDMNDHVYKMEDKGSCITRIKTEDYENNVQKNLDNAQMFEKINIE